MHELLAGEGKRGSGVARIPYAAMAWARCRAWMNSGKNGREYNVSGGIFGARKTIFHDALHKNPLQTRLVRQKSTASLKKYHHSDTLLNS
jgi:hypothetical protein